MYLKYTNNASIKNKIYIVIVLYSIEKNNRELYLFSIDKFIEKLVSRQRNNRLK